MHRGLSQKRFEANEASLLLKLLAFNLAGILRGEMEASSSDGRDLKRLQQTVLKAGVRVTEHSRRLIADVGGGAAKLWDRLLRRPTWRHDPSASSVAPPSGGLANRRGRR